MYRDSNDLILGWIDLSKLRVPGVLQRFGISYWIVASTAAIFAKEQDENNDKENQKSDEVIICEREFHT